MRILSLDEEKNLKSLTKNSISLALIEPTATGLKKSIMDATGPVRSYLKTNGYHNYEVQRQGPKNKVIFNAWIYNKSAKIKSQASLYRPETKKGDPRIWFSSLSKYAQPNDILALVCFNKEIHVINLTALPIKDLLDTTFLNPIKELIHEISGIENTTANELLLKLRSISSKPIPSLIKADTSVGRTLEAALGIKINSSKKPDYKGIELKSFRDKRGNRKNLFAQVPDWNISKFKSSSEILDAFGYLREDDFKLYCTVSAIKTNSQGLALRINNDTNCLVEYSTRDNINDFAIWKLEKLHNRLIEKHKETFWVAADVIEIGEIEHFQFKEVEHTKKPIISQFDILLEQGVITLDHLIKRNSRGKVIEKGPLFKIKPNSLDLLFPPSKVYDLRK